MGVLREPGEMDYDSVIFLEARSADLFQNASNLMLTWQVGVLAWQILQ